MATLTDTNDLDVRRRRALWRAGHRGMRELDLVLGAYARQRVAGMDAVALGQFEMILDVPDPELFDWIMGKTPVPPQYQGPIIDAIRQLRFCPESYQAL